MNTEGLERKHSRHREKQMQRLRDKINSDVYQKVFQNSGRVTNEEDSEYKRRERKEKELGKEGSFKFSSGQPSLSDREKNGIPSVSIRYSLVVSCWQLSILIAPN